MSNPTREAVKQLWVTSGGNEWDELALQTASAYLRALDMVDEIAARCDPGLNSFACPTAELESILKKFDGGDDE